MANEARVEVHGARELAAGSKRLAGDIQERAPEAFLGVADTVAAATRARVPRRSGALAGDVEAGVEGEGALAGYGGGVPYAGYVEFGGTHGRPYIPSGRYLFPFALNVGAELEAAGARAADHEIRGFRWPTPSR